MKPDPRATLVEVASQFIGTKEVGRNGGPTVERFQKAVDGKAQGEPWCMCFVQFCIKEVENRLNIQSNIFRGESCLQVWNDTPILLRRDHPEMGFIVIWNRVGTVSGHCGIVTGLRSPEVFQTIEGNTSNGLGLEQEGEGVFRKDRSIIGTQLFQIKGWIQPF